VTVSHERLARAEAILDQVTALPERERTAAVARLCAGDRALVDEVMSLLEHAGRVGAFLETPALGGDFRLLPATPSVAANRDDDIIGRRVGHYRLERRIASGGMGTVYLASRADEQFTQRVALKIVKRGMDTDEILARFRRERQTLAALEHPAIARLIDGGATEAGQPFLAMEFVEGEPIDAYCDRRRLDVVARLELFLVVCEAVSYAHQKLVVHRDLKPGNILVTSEGRPKLVDFGIATVLDAADAGSVTAALDRRLTPEYASPEHIAGRAVATTSDVYSLGVILYELLTGRRPYYWTTRALDDIQRVIADTDPPAPSASVRRTTSQSEGREAAALRRTTPERLARRLRGDLDTIVLAALRREPERRYPSVEQLALDLRRHLGQLPVSAHRDSFAYRARKFVRRHALATCAAALAFLFLAAGGSAFAWQAREARRERDRALTARAQSEAITQFLQDMLASVDPSRSGRNVTVQEVLHAAARRLETELRGQPLVRASLHETVGSTYLALGLYEEAETQLRAAYDIRVEALGARHREVAESAIDLATALHAQHEFDEAVQLLDGAVAVCRAAGETSGAALTTALSSLGAVRRAQGRLDDAESLQREALDVCRARGDAESLEVATCLNNLAGVLFARQRFDEAVPLLEDALRIRREQLGEEHPLVAQGTDNLAVLLANTGDLDAAEPLYAKALELEIRLLGPEHPDVAVTRRNLAFLLTARGRYAEAETELRTCLAIRAKLFEASDARRVIAQIDLAKLLLAEGRGDEAARLVDAALAATAGLARETDARRAALALGAGFFERRGDGARAEELLSELERGSAAAPPAVAE
jgi:serine/threonine-protein kinase